MGLDLSLTSTGYSIDGTTGVISFDSIGPRRLSSIRDAIYEIVSSEPDLRGVVIEGYSFASRNSQAHSIGELGGVVRLMLWEKAVPYVVVPPTSRAKFATGKGNASKNEVISFISAKTGIVWGNPGADDKCDAWVLEEMGLCRAGKARFEWPKDNKAALDKVDWEPLGL